MTRTTTRLRVVLLLLLLVALALLIATRVAQRDSAAPSHSRRNPAPATAVPSRAGGTGGAEADATEPFGIRGDLETPLAPGRGGPLRLTLANPHDYSIEVTSLVVSVDEGSSRPGCDGKRELAVRQSNIGAGTASLTIPPRSTVRLPSGAARAPVVRMRNRVANQDRCKQARFTLRYAGAAHRGST